MEEKGKRAAMQAMLGLCTAGGEKESGVEKESEGDGIPAAKKQKTYLQAPGTASAKEQDPDEHTPPKAGGTEGKKSGNAPEKPDTDEENCQWIVNDLPDEDRKCEWSIVQDESRSHWTVRTGWGGKCFSYKYFGITEVEAFEEATHRFMVALWMRRFPERYDPLRVREFLGDASVDSGSPQT